MKINLLRPVALLALFLVSLSGFSQADVRSTITQYLSSRADEYRITPTQAGAFTVTDDYTSRHNGVRHVYITQTVNGLRIVNRILNVTISPEGEIVHMAGKVAPLGSVSQPSPVPGIQANQAILSACGQLNIPNASATEEIPSTQPSVLLFAGADISQEDIPVELVYWLSPEDELFLAWSLSIYTHDSENWYHAMVDARTGKLLETANWVVHCSASVCGKFPEVRHTHISKPASLAAPALPGPPPPMNSGAYRVYAFPTETPIHGPHILVVNPADSMASPYGWHDTNGQPGAEYTITRGNNVHAYEDKGNNNQPGYSPDGGPTLLFDYPVNLSQHPNSYTDAAVTNLFYANNMIHDITYHFGFDEPAGNFQQNNYGRGGIGNDYVRAEAQDGGGSNNANFATPADGNRPRMQMYLWSAGSSVNFHVNAPLNLSGPYGATGAGFGNALPTTPLTSDLVLALDNDGLDPEDACEPIVNAAALAGKVAVIRRGNCPFVDKVQAAENAGAVAVVIVNNVTGNPITMGGSSSTITIPSIMISQAAGEPIITALKNSITVNGTLAGSGSGALDGDFDNGVIVHEYGHGISNRLTGGPSAASCLNNAEQMGEGWSDYFGMMLTMNLAANNPVNRPIGAYLLGNTVAGPGIRNESYDTSFAVNNYTYGHVSNTGLLSQPHGIGFVWATMLWDLTWALMAQHGYDDVPGNGIGGDDIAMQLVMDGLKLQACQPGFVDGRDAILLADQLNYGGANRCIIWKAFAKRGLGFSASQGSSASRTDQVQAFDLPTFCMQPVTPPRADFKADTTQTCTGKIQFTDLSTFIPQQWFWDFGDGTTSTFQNPVHQYSQAGVYTVKLVVVNTLGSDTSSQVNYINYTRPDAPVTVGASGCDGDTLQVSANASGTLIWMDANFAPFQTGTSHTVIPPAVTTTYYVVNEIGAPAVFVGPKDESIGASGLHNTTFTGTVDFTADIPLTIKSAYINAGAAGSKTITLWDNLSGSGNMVQQVTVSIPSPGPQRVELNLQVEKPGSYSIGLNNANLFRNSTGANYPYTIPGVISLVGSSAGAQFYYYFYDLEVKQQSCYSDTVAIVAVVLDQVDFGYHVLGNQTFRFNDLSGASANWHWDFGDGSTSTDETPDHQYAAPGKYTVTLTIGSCSHSQEITVFPTGIEGVGENPYGAVLQPNPAQQSTELRLTRPLPADAHFRLVTMDGRIAGTWTVRAGELHLQLPIAHLAPAVYMLVADEPQYGITLPLVVMD